MALFNSLDNENAFVQAVTKMADTQARQMDIAEQASKLFLKLGRYAERFEPLMDKVIDKAIEELKSDLGIEDEDTTVLSLVKDEEPEDQDDSPALMPPFVASSGAGFTDQQTEQISREIDEDGK